MVTLGSDVRLYTCVNVITVPQFLILPGFTHPINVIVYDDPLSGCFQALINQTQIPSGAWRHNW